MTIYYLSSDIAGVFYGKLIEIIINKDEKRGKYTRGILFFAFCKKKVSERLGHLVLLESIETTCLVQNIIEFGNSTS